jgi:hypothetical protein
MAAAVESQGLKITVAVLVTLTVIFAVTTYFGFKYYSEAKSRLVQSELKASSLSKSNGDALKLVESLRKQVGLRAEDEEGIGAELKNAVRRLDDDVKRLVEHVDRDVSQAQAAGAQGPEIEEAKQLVLKVAAGFRVADGTNVMSALSYATDALSNLTLLNTRLSLAYLDVRASVAAAKVIEAEKLDLAERALRDKAADLASEQQKHVAERQLLQQALERYQAKNARLAAENARLASQIEAGRAGTSNPKVNAPASKRAGPAPKG